MALIGWFIARFLSFTFSFKTTQKWPSVKFWINIFLRTLTRNWFPGEVEREKLQSTKSGWWLRSRCAAIIAASSFTKARNSMPRRRKFGAKITWASKFCASLSAARSVRRPSVSKRTPRMRIIFVNLEPVETLNLGVKKLWPMINCRFGSKWKKNWIPWRNLVSKFVPFRW